MDAQFNLGCCYYSGSGVKQNYKQAVKWHTKAAEQGNEKAQYNLAVCYQNGQGVRQNMNKALEWYKKSAKQGYEVAIRVLEQIGL